MAGTLARNMPIMPPGMFLSQPPTTTTPSIHWPPTQVSMQSEITSRLTSEYFMPSVMLAERRLILMGKVAMVSRSFGESG